MPYRHRKGGRRRATEVDRWDRVGQPVQPRLLDPQVGAGVVDGLTAPQRVHHVQELVGARVPGVLVEEVAVRSLLL
ncbi:hypothetical protein GCM10027614_05050 [Micromonospora vulcania]